jgi:signal transduction histidine kinase
MAAGGAEGIAAFEREHPDCVLLDVRMPDVDGFTVCERIRASAPTSETAVIFLTALRDVDTFDQALRVGGDDFLTKPFRPAELVVRVQGALKMRRLRVELREHFELLKDQRDNLMRTQLQKERLTAFVVHDLKTPVNVMDLCAQGVLREPNLPESVREAATHIRGAAKQLTRMIANLLDISKADEGLLQPRPSSVDLEALVGGVVRELAASADARGVRLEHTVAGDSGYATLDPELLRRTLTNLLENAIRHAPADTAVRISSSNGPEGVEFRVADRGPGIAPAMRERVFQPFVQGNGGADRSGAQGNRGLGLTFCKVAAEAHGGRICVEDGEPGAVFCVRLPGTAPQDEVA